MRKIKANLDKNTSITNPLGTLKSREGKNNQLTQLYLLEIAYERIPSLGTLGGMPY